MKIKFIVNIPLLLFFFAFLQLNGQKIYNLEEALNVARVNSPNIRKAKLSYVRSKELLNAQDASLKSQFSFTLEPMSYDNNRTFNDYFSTWYTSESKQSSGTFSVVQPLIWTDGTLSLSNQFLYRDSKSEVNNSTSRTFTNNLYLAFNQPFFTYNRTRLQYDEVRLDMENALLNYRIQMLNLEQVVARSFYDVYQRKMSLKVAEEELRNTTASYDLIKKKVDAGLIAQEEFYQAEVNLATSKSSVNNAKVAYENSLDAFKQTLGTSLYEDATVAADVAESSVKADLNKAIEHALQYRMELRQRQINLIMTRNDITRAAASNEFKGNVSLRYGVIGNDEALKAIYDQPAQDQQLLLRFDIPLYDWGAKESRVKAAEATLASSKISEEEQKKDIIIEIRQAYRNLENQKFQIENARQNIKVSQLTYDINLERYQNGDLTSMDLNLFQSQLSEKKISLVDAIIGYKLALLDLKIRSLWDFEKNKPVLSDDATIEIEENEGE